MIEIYATVRTCEVCRKREAELICKGPMIWMRVSDGELRGLRRPEKRICFDCAKLPIETLWPIVDPLDYRAVTTANFTCHAAHTSS